MAVRSRGYREGLDTAFLTLPKVRPGVTHGTSSSSTARIATRSRRGLRKTASEAKFSTLFRRI